MWLDRDRAVLRTVIEANAADHPERPVVEFEDGETWNSVRVRDESYRAANVLASWGVRQGDRVGIMLANGPDFVRAWWGARCLGTAVMPMNPALKGRMLSHPLGVAEPDVVVTTPDQAAAAADELAPYRTLDPAALREGPAGEPRLRRPIELADPEVILMTSGTTGPSKLWSSTVLQASTTGAYVRDGNLTPADRFLVDLPLFHTAGLGVTAGCMRSGTVAVLRRRPSLARYFEIARDAGVTAGFLVGSMAAKLLATPRTPYDRDHRLRVMVAAPLPPDLDRFVERFGVERILTSFGSTETGGPIGTGAHSDLPTPGSAGRERPGYGEYKLVDGGGAEVPTGEVGELLIRPAHEAMLRGHYLKDEEANARAWDGGWFHTGDLFRKSPDGEYFWVGRDRDTIRRRGENISSFEVEREVMLEPAVASVACVGVDAHDDVGVEVKVYVVAVPGVETVDFEAMAGNLAERMPAYMVPRYFELIDELPMTATQRVAKYLLRQRGNDPGTWDRKHLSTIGSQRGGVVRRFS
ncbi:AMP-binding protein [Phytohabitans suffuscus]|uniref:ATP-dependent acyl-CoA ligase n=1 Tax=Phytohabitans suffuscus TaxID=624315 RepID=A0A6F8YUY9_9ACTN|nr:AMP-binding protein [Phytohabitans suffuscus]BCB89889.1 ATP-dependent acyl-CoA ligase [Phytohabitans suffuscus]